MTEITRRFAPTIWLRLLGVVGFALTTAGIALVSIAAALIVAGILLVGVAAAGAYLVGSGS